MNEEEKSWGLSALGTADSFEVSLNEGIEQEAWELEFSYGQTTIAFYIDSPEVAVSILEFMKENYGKTFCRHAKEGEYPGVQKGTKLYREVASLEIRTPGPLHAFMSKCGELPDRFHFGLSGKNNRYHIDFHDPHTSRLVTALEGLVTDIENS